MAQCVRYLHNMRLGVQAHLEFVIHHTSWAPPHQYQYKKTMLFLTENYILYFRWHFPNKSFFCYLLSKKYLLQMCSSQNETINFLLIRIYSMQGWTATIRHGLARKRSTKWLKHIGNLFRTTIQLKRVCYFWT